jgi:MFS family permease
VILVAKRFYGWLFGESGAQRIIVFSGLVDALGTGLFLAVSTLFFVNQVGLSATQVGLGLSVAGAVGFFASVPVGSLGDRFSARNVLIALNL